MKLTSAIWDSQFHKISRYLKKSDTYSNLVVDNDNAINLCVKGTLLQIVWKTKNE